jgi:hypothetical protein
MRSPGKTLVLVTAFVYTQFLPSFTLAGIFVFQAGQDDDHASPADPASPSGHLEAVQLAGGGNAYFPFVDFDLTAGLNGGSGNTTIGHTFADLPNGIISATLQLRVRAGTPDAGAATDTIELLFVDSADTDFEDALAYLRFFGAFAGNATYGPDPGLLQSSWGPGDDVEFSLNLAALPLAGGGTLNLLPALNSHGFLDVVVEDDSAADYFRLTVETAEASAVPEPTSLLVWSVMGLAGVAGCVWRRKKAE